jgi:MFS family permease
MSATEAPAVWDRRAVLRALWPVTPGIVLGSLDAPMVATALGRITDDLGQLDVAAWVVTAYLLTASASAVTYGRLGDIYGRRKVLRAATAIFLVGAVAAGFSRTMGQLILARAVQGAGGGGLVAVALAALADSVPARVRGRYLGYIGAIFAACNLGGPLLAGVLVEAGGWRPVFLVNVPIAVAGLVIGSGRWASAEGERSAAARLDVVGALLLAWVAACSLLFLRRVELGLATLGATSVALALAAAGVAGLGWFVARQRRAEHPLIPPAMLTNPVFAIGLAGTFLGAFVMFAALVYVPLYFQIVSPVTGIGAALLLTPFMVGFLVGTLLPGRTLGRSGRYKRYPILGSVCMLVGVGLLSTIGPGSVPAARAYLVITGLGVGLTMQVLLLVVQNGVRYADMGTATSATALVRAVGGATGIAAFSTVIGSGVLGRITDAQSRRSGLVPAPLVRSFTAGLNTAFLVAVPVVVLSLLFAWRLKEQPLRDSVRGE